MFNNLFTSYTTHFPLQTLRPLQKKKKITSKQFSELLQGFQSFRLHHQRKPPKSEEGVWVGVGSVRDKSYCCQNPAPSGWLVTQCGWQLRERLSWCLEKEKKKNRSANLFSASNNLHFLNLGQVDRTASPPCPPQSAGWPWLSFHYDFTSTKQRWGLGGVYRNCCRCTPGLDWTGRVLLGPNMALLVFLGMLSSFCTYMLYFFLMTWFWVGQQTCLFAQLDLNWLLVQTSGGFIPLPVFLTIQGDKLTPI